MPSDLKSLEQEALQLPEDQRITLAHRILLSTEAPGDPAVDEWWEGELEERIRRIDAGETERIRSSEVFRALDERLGK